MTEIRAEIRSLIDKYRTDANRATNLNEEDFTSALVVIINRETREVSEYAISKITSTSVRPVGNSE